MALTFPPRALSGVAWDGPHSIVDQARVYVRSSKTCLRVISQGKPHTLQRLSFRLDLVQELAIMAHDSVITASYGFGQGSFAAA